MTREREQLVTTTKTILEQKRYSQEPIRITIFPAVQTVRERVSAIEIKTPKKMTNVSNSDCVDCACRIVEANLISRN